MRYVRDCAEHPCFKMCAYISIGMRCFTFHIDAVTQKIIKGFWTFILFFFLFTKNWIKSTEDHLHSQCFALWFREGRMTIFLVIPPVPIEFSSAVKGWYVTDVKKKKKVKGSEIRDASRQKKIFEYYYFRSIR